MAFYTNAQGQVVQAPEGWIAPPGETWTSYTAPGFVTDFGSFSDPEAAAAGMQGMAGDARAMRTPAEDWARLQTGMRPFWQERAPMQDLASRMLGRYYLGAPYASTAQNPSPSFADFMTRYAGAGAPAMADLETLRERAREAALAGTYVGGVGAYAAAAETPEQLARRGVYGSLFGQGAENQSANQLAVAQTLAMQRAGGGTYRGRMADAIRRGMERVQQHRVGQGAPRESFLDWYLGRYHPEAETPAAETPAAETTV